jgi:hypothetical protein
LHEEIEEDEMDGAHSTHGEMREIYEILVGKSERETSHGRPRYRWEDNMYIL